MKLKKTWVFLNQDNPDEPSKPGLISKTRNSWNLKLELYQEGQFQIKLMLKDEIKKIKKTDMEKK
jgi:hypothetical protein